MIRRIALSILALAALALTLTSPAATSLAAPTAPAAPACPQHTTIQHWSSKTLALAGFRTQLYGGDQAEVGLNGKTLALNVAADPNNAGYVAARITDIDTSVPIAERVHCWKPTADKAVEVNFSIRFTQPQVAPGMTENMMLWNSPMADPAHPELPIPLTAFGVSRALGSYTTVVVQNLDLMTFQASVYHRGEMPAWLDATAWHTVTMRVAQDRVTIHISQGDQSALVSDVMLPNAPVATGMEFSVDNEGMPGQYPPITVPDGAEIGFYRAGYVNATR